MMFPSSFSKSAMLLPFVSAHFLVLCCICICCFPGFTMAAIVTLDSIQIFRTHELIFSPTIYFKCKHENMTVLPDVKKQNVVYNYKGEESWQPVTQMGTKKCKRCGIYVMHRVKSDDPFDEWEFCPSQFAPPLGKYTYAKKHEFNATFSCPMCSSLGGDEKVALIDDTSHEDEKNKKIRVETLVAAIAASVVIGMLLIVGIERSIRKWQRKKRMEEQARFVKLFEYGDDIEDELGTIV